MKIPNIKTDKNKIVSKRPISKYHKMRNKKNQTQTIGPSPSKLNRPEASMIPILKPPSNYLVSNDQVPTRNSNSETNQSISQLDNDNGNKPPYQFPLKEYTQEILNMTKFTKIENSSSTYFAPEDLYKPSILQQPNKIYNKTISKFSNSNSPANTESRPTNNKENNSYFLSQSSFSSHAENALNFTFNEEKLRPISFLEKVKKLKAKKKQNAASKPVHYQSYGSKTSITQSPYKIQLSEDSTNESPGMISITTGSPLHISSDDYKYLVTTDQNHPGAIQVTVR